MDTSSELIFGYHSVRAVYLTRPEAIKRVILLGGKKPPPQDYLDLVKRGPVEPEIRPWHDFLQVTGLAQDEKHQGIALFAAPRTVYGERDLASLRDGRLVLVLDQISNPQNLATILRNGAFFGVDAVLLLVNRSTDLSPRVTRVAVGGAEFVKFFKVINLARSLERLKEVGYWVYGLDERGENVLAETRFSEKTVFVVGAEGEGLRQRTKKVCDVLVRIPGGRLGLESLNAGVATAVALAEFSRQHPAAAPTPLPVVTIPLESE